MYINPSYGFSMVVPECGVAVGSDATLALFNVSLHGSHMGNVNVGVNMVKTTREECLAEVLGAISRQGQKVNSQKLVRVSGRDGFILDTEGQLEGRDCRFLALYVVDDDHVIVFTCTAARRGYDEACAQFLATLESVTFAERK